MGAFLPAGVRTTWAGIGGVPLLAINTGDRTGDGDDILLVIQDGPGDGGDLTILRLPGCGVDVLRE